MCRKLAITMPYVVTVFLDSSVSFRIVTKLLKLSTAKNAQVAKSPLTSCNNLLQQADIRMRSHGLRQFVDVKSCKLSTDLMHVHCPNVISTGLVQVVSTS